ncbi:MAG TPA: hypothetical protein VEO54_09455 [Thermoanaerobaculia bacterium]|nr:hypothetical protein [Thermoanaerobaculia bacterium]
MLETARAHVLANSFAIPLAPSRRSERLGEGVRVALLEACLHVRERNHFEAVGLEAVHDRSLGAIEERLQIDLRPGPLRVMRRAIDGKDRNLLDRAETRLIEVVGRFLAAPPDVESRTATATARTVCLRIAPPRNCWLCGKNTPVARKPGVAASVFSSLAPPTAAAGLQRPNGGQWSAAGARHVLAHVGRGDPLA